MLPFWEDASEQHGPPDPTEKMPLLQDKGTKVIKGPVSGNSGEVTWKQELRNKLPVMIKSLSMVAALYAVTSTARVLNRSNAGPTYQFCFGDSYTSTNFDINGAQPSLPDNPMGNTDLGNHETSANGPVWINYLTTKYDAMPVLTYNFAVGGASIPDNYTYQVNNLYQPKYTTNEFWLGSNTLHLSWVGINDCSDCWLQGVNLTAISTRLNHYLDLLETFYQTGARNLFIVNVPPLDRSPYILGGGAESSGHYKSCVDNFNENLPSIVNTWQSNHPDATAIIYDVHTFFGNVLDNPNQYFFTNNTCQDAANCIWSGNFHILSAMHDIIAKDMQSVLSKYVYNG